MESSLLSSPSKGCRPNVLLVEDHRGYRQVVKLGLETFLDGWEVAEAESVAEAGRILRGQAFRVLVCDMVLPDGSAADVVEECAAAKSGGMRVILFSNHSEEQMKFADSHPCIHGQIAKERGVRELARLIEHLTGTGVHGTGVECQPDSKA
ncbi:MAG: response regulator [Verrucomicrobiaceae bacterium]|nr:response regulator [Verrucomicrobiaceae bacterium]